MSSTIENKITRLLSEAVEESEPNKVQQAFNDLRYLKETNPISQPDRSSVSDNADAVSSYLYLYCAEAAVRFNQWEIVKHCVDQLKTVSQVAMPSSASAKQRS